MFQQKYNFLLSLFLLFFVSSVFAQNETNHWYFGNNAGMDFSNGDFSVLNNGSMQTPAGCASISDRDGNLLFYTNGQTVWNSNHQIMENGTGLAGEIDGIQTAIIIPKPDDTTTYYIFYVRRFTQTTPTYLMTGIYYSEVKFDAQNPLGYITNNKDVRIAEVMESTARFTAIHHPESNSVRVICMTKPNPPPFGSPPTPDNVFVFRVFNVNESGVNDTPIVREINEGYGRIGAMKISPNGQHLAVADTNANVFMGQEHGRIYFYKYNNETINFEFDFQINTIPSFGLFLNPYGIEFSQDSKMFYYTGGNYIVQFPFSDFGNVDIFTYHLMSGPSPRSIQLARNGKIYVAHGEPNNSVGAVSVINRPERLGEECEYSSLSVALAPGSSSQGLPIFIASSLRNRIIASDDDCVDTTFGFNLDAYVPITSALWDFGDGTTSTSLTPTHQFSQPGIHKVSATIIVNDYPVTLYREVEAYPLPSLDPNQTMQQCDTDNGGASFFNLENIGNKMNNPNPDYEYVFYHSLNDAENDINPISDHHVYQNQSNPEEIFVKITSPKGCTTISNFYIETTYTDLGEIPPIYACGENENGEGKFNIDNKIAEIRQQFNLPDTFSIKVYTNAQDAQTTINPLSRYHTSVSTTVWVRVEDESQGCNGIGSFQLIVNQALSLNIESNYIICDGDLQPSIVLDGGPNNDIWEWRNNSGTIISTSRNFTLTQAGTFSLTVYRTENEIQCSAQKQFVVTQGGEVQFNQVSTENNQIYVSVIGNSMYEFSIDGNNFYGHGNSYTFTGTATGFHVVYVRDVYNCEAPISQEVFLLNFPAFFTPNGDGINDYWRISSLSTRLFPEIEIYIFDRYGKVIKHMAVHKDAFGWDGTYKGEKLLATDYWFKATLKDLSGNMIEKKGHFSLLR